MVNYASYFPSYRAIPSELPSSAPLSSSSLHPFIPSSCLSLLIHAWAFTSKKERKREASLDLIQTVLFIPPTASYTYWSFFCSCKHPPTLSIHASIFPSFHLPSFLPFFLIYISPPPPYGERAHLYDFPLTLCPLFSICKFSYVMDIDNDLLCHQSMGWVSGWVYRFPSMERAVLNSFG